MHFVLCELHPFWISSRLYRNGYLFYFACMCTHACRYRSSNATVCIRRQPADVESCLCVLIETEPPCSCVSLAWWPMRFRRLFCLCCPSLHSGMLWLENYGSACGLYARLKSSGLWNQCFYLAKGLSSLSFTRPFHTCHHNSHRRLRVE